MAIGTIYMLKIHKFLIHSSLGPEPYNQSTYPCTSQYSFQKHLKFNIYKTYRSPPPPPARPIPEYSSLPIYTVSKAKHLGNILKSDRLFTLYSQTISQISPIPTNYISNLSPWLYLHGHHPSPSHFYVLPGSLWLLFNWPKCLYLYLAVWQPDIYNHKSDHIIPKL